MTGPVAASQFRVREVHDVVGRSGLLASGTVFGEPINAGAILYSTTSERPIRVLGVELATLDELRQRRFTLMLERSEVRVAPGDVLEAGPSAPVGTVRTGSLRRHTFLLGESYDDMWPVFFIEERAEDCGDVVAQLAAAEDALDAAGVIYGVEVEFGHVGPAPLGLASWVDFRQRHFVDGTPLPVRAVSERVIPPGWAEMLEETRNAHKKLLAEMVGLLTQVTGVRHPWITDDRGPTRWGPASVNWSEEDYGFHVQLVAASPIADQASTAAALGRALAGTGWHTSECPDADGDVTVEGERAGFAVQAWVDRARITLTAYSPIYRAPADPNGPAWIATPRDAR